MVIHPFLSFGSLPDDFLWYGICTSPWMGGNTKGVSWDRVEMDYILEKRVAVHSSSGAFLSISVW